MAVERTDLTGRSLLLYDGVCGLCNRFIQFVLRRDKRDHFRFVALQDELATKILARHGLDASRLNSVCLVTSPLTRNELVAVRSDAVAIILRELGWPWRTLSYALRIIPRPVRDAVYGLVARLRYRVFGRLQACPLPSVEQRRLFLTSQ